MAPASHPPLHALPRHPAGKEGLLIVAIPLYDRFTGLDAVGPYEILRLQPNVGAVHFVGQEDRIYTADSGLLNIKVTKTFQSLPDPDIIIIPGGGTEREIADPSSTLVEWVKAAHATTWYTFSVCTGALVLGAAGLLKGLEATTHWGSYDKLREYGAIVAEQPERVIAYFDKRVGTAAGISSGIDFALWVAAAIKGPRYAKAAQLAIEYDPVPPYNAGAPWAPEASPELQTLALELLHGNKDPYTSQVPQED